MSYTPPKYPAEIPTQTGETPDLPNRIDDLDWLYAARYNELKLELIAVMTELGVLPKGSYADVAARLAACIAIAAPANGDILIRSGGAWVSLPKGSDDQILKLVSGLPAWAAAPGGAIPAGLIAMWHGTIANIPSGWVICDGNNGTPNLLSKFVKGVATAATNPGATGGASTVTLDATQIPAHQHSIAASGTHHHNIKNSEDVGGGSYASASPTPGDNMQSDESGDHSHGGNTGSVGGGLSHENEPPYYAVAYIMKT